MAENDSEKSPAEGTRDPRLLYADDEQESGIFRWMSALVVLLAVAGFFGLAWYAYKSGGEAVDEKDVELVKADKGPVKEAPANPGGMQIPNQDKTVYGLINGNKSDKPTVERILPAPEEPIVRGGSDTETWMSDKIKNKMSGTDNSERPAENTTSSVSAPASVTAVEEPKKTEQFNPAQVQVTQNTQDSNPKVKPEVVSANPTIVTPPSTTVTAIAPKPVAPMLSADNATPQVKTEIAPQTKPVIASKPAETEDDNDEQDETPATKAVKADVKQPVKGARAQLGAYKSEAEAQSNWTKIARQFSGEIGNKEHYVVRADLGEKGVYYRLQVAPFASAKDAEQFCLTFVSAGQNCFLAKVK